MDFDKVHRENLVLYSKLFKETDHEDFPAVGFSSSSSQYCLGRVFNNLDHLIIEGSSYPLHNLLHSPFYDPFGPFKASFGKLNQENYPALQTFAEETPNGHMHGSQSRRLPDPSPKSSLQTVVDQELEKKSCLILDSNVKRKRKDSKKKEPVQTRRSRRIIDQKPDIIKGQWTADEDRLLEKLVEKHGVRKWSSIAQMLPGRIGKQCRERWHNHLKPDIKKDGWSDEEDRILIEAHRQVGNRWAEIARSLPGRSENTIKNHWNATKRRQLSSSRKNNSSISPLQDYIRNVISSSNRHSSSHSSPSKISENMNAGNHDQCLIGMQFDFDKKETDFMEMLAIGYI